MKWSEFFCLFLVLIVFAGMVFILLTPFALAISQDEYCAHHNFSLISVCNEWWEFETMNRTIIVFVDNSSESIVYFNESCDLDSFHDDFVDELQDDFVLLDEDDFEGEVSDIVSDFSIDDEYSWDKYQKDLDHQFRMAELQANSSSVVVVADCDYLCQFKKQIKMEQEIELMRLQYCSLNPNLKSCISVAALDSVSSPKDNSSSSAAFSVFRDEVLGLLAEDRDVPESSSFNFGFLFVGVLAVVASFFGYKEFVKQKKAKDYGNFRDEGEMVSKQKLIDEVSKFKQEPSSKLSPFHKEE